MSHSHRHQVDFGRAFAIGILLNTAFIGTEVAFGLLSDSLTLLADAGHNLSDVMGLLIAWGATNLERRSPTKRFTYGLRRTSVLAALANAILLLVSIGAIAWEAIRRLREPAPVAGLTMIWVAAVGVVVNGLTAWLFVGGRKGDLNIRGAFLHMIADAAVSAGVVVAGFAILYTGWSLLDPISSLAIVAIILVGTWGLLRDSINLVLDAVPRGIDPGAVQEFLEQLPGVAAIHHLHVWGLSTTETACTAHVVKREPQLDDQLLKQIAHELHERFGIEHTTIQFERCDGPDCPTEHEEHTTMNDSAITKAVLLAAGRGTRMRDLTNELPKPMIAVRGKPILQHIIEGLRAAGVEQFFIVVGWRAEVVRQMLGDGARFGVTIHYATQVVQDGTGKVVELAHEFVGDDSFVLSYGDILVDPLNYRRLVDLECGTEAIVTVKHSEDVSKGGAVFVNERFELIDLREKPKPGEPTSPWYNAGIYAFRPSIFDFTARLEAFAPRRVRADRRDSRARAIRQKSAGD